MANADISLLFGVLGEGSLSGESGSLIQSQLTQIMTALNKNPLKVKVALDSVAEGKKSWQDQLQAKLDSVSKSSKFSVQISKLTLGAGAISDFRNQLKAVINTLNLDKGTSITLNADGIGEIKSKIKEAGDAAQEAARKTAEFRVQLEALDAQRSPIKRSVDSMRGTGTSDDETARINGIVAQYEAWALKIEEVRASKEAVSTTYRAELEAEGAAIANNIHQLEAEREAAAQAAQAAAQSAARQAAAEQEAAAASERASREARDNANAQRELMNARKQGVDLLIRMQAAERNWTAARSGKSSEEYIKIQQYITSLQQLLEQLNGSEPDVAVFRQRIAELNKDFTTASGQIRSAGENTKVFGERLGGLAQKFSAWFSVTRVIMAAVRAVRAMISNTTELDASLAQLQIVTNASDTEMEAFLTRATGLAKELGKSITEVLGSIETFSRLGYNLEDASKLAEYASILSNVASVDTQSATTGLTSIIKGFNMNVGDSEHVADVLIEVGQKYAVSASEMMEAFEKSGAALNAANTSFEKSAGLIAAANASVQNASTVGTALKTISARIRGAKADLEELGEETGDLAQGFSKYAAEIKALTGFDIMVDGSTDQYKDIFEIFEGISKAWDRLSDTQQSRVSEILGGTRQLQVISSILGNWDDAVKAYSDAMESAGVATQANSIYMDTVQARVNQLKASFQELSNTLISSDFLKSILDFARGFMDVLNSLARVIDSIGGLNTVLKVTVGIIATMKGNAIWSWVKNLGGMLTNLIGVFPKLLTAFQTYIAMSRLSATNTAAAAAVYGQSTTALGRMSAALTSAGIAASAAQVAIGLLAAVVVGLSIAWSTHKRHVEENRKAMNDAAEAANQERESISELIAEYKGLATAGDFDQSSRDRAKEIQAEITDLVGQQAENLDLVNGKLDEQIKKLDDIRFKEAEKAKNALDTKYRDALSEYNAGINATGSGTNFLGVVTDAPTINEALELAGYVNHELENAGGVLSISFGLAGKNAKEVLEIYKEIQAVLLESNDWQEQADEYVGTSAQDILNGIQSKIDFYQGVVDEFDKAKTDFLENQAIIDLGNYVKTTGISDTGSFDAYIEAVRNSTAYSEQYKEILIDIANQTFPEFSSAMGNTVEEINRSTDRAVELANNISRVKDEIERLSQYGGNVDLMNRKKVNVTDANIGIINTWGGGPQVGDYMTVDSQTFTNEKGTAIVVTPILPNGELLTQDELNQYVDEIFANSNYKQNDKHGILMGVFDGGSEAGNIAQAEGFAVRVHDMHEQLITYQEEFGDLMQSGSLHVAEYTASLGELDKQITSTKEAYDILNAAEQDMQTGKGLSAETIKSIAAAEDNYLDFLYEENGVIKLNTSAWEENAKSKLQSTANDLKKEIASIKDKNALLKESIAYYQKQQKDNAIGGSWDAKIGALHQELQSNNEQLEKAEGNLATINTIVESIFANLDNPMSFDTQLETIATTEKAISSLSTALGNFRDNGSLTGETLNNLQATFGKLSSFRSFVTALSSAETSMEDAQAAMNKLAREYIQTTGILDNITEETAALTEARLSAMGVENAHELVMQRLSAANLEAMVAALDLEEAEWSKVEAMLKAAGATATEVAALKELRQEQFNAAIAATNFVTAGNSVIESLKSQAQLAGATAQQYAALSKIQSLKAQYTLEAKTLHGAEQRDLWKGFEQEAAKIAEEAMFGDKDFEVTIPVVTVAAPESKGSGSKASKDIEEYTADIDKLHKQLQKLKAIQDDVDRENARAELLDDQDFDAKVRHHQALIDLYMDEQKALHAIAEERRKMIAENVKKLTDLKFDISYDPDYNKMVVNNLDHINDITAASQGAYSSMTEATNAYRKEIEELIKTTISMVDANEENSDTWRSLQSSIKSAKVDIVNSIKEIAVAASNAVDEIQNVYDTLHSAADEFAANGDFISIDTYQAILDLGPQYMQMLKDENGLWRINEQAINDVIAAKTEQLAVDTAMSYVERLKLAAQEGSIESLNNLVYATTDATNSTWGLVYANMEVMRIMGDLDDSQYEAAMHNIQAIRDLGKAAIQGIGNTAGAVKAGLEETKKSLQSLLTDLNDMQSGAGKLLDYVMAMLRKRVEEQISGLEELKDKFSEIIDLKKKSLDASKEEADYQSQIASKVKEMAKLQERIDALSLEGTRASEAEKAGLMEQMAALQEELADKQAEKAIDVQKDSLDKMESEYHAEKDKEITILQDSISSTQKLYDMAIDYIRKHWDTLYSELIEWNTQYGNDLNSDITDAWEAAQDAARRYGDYVTAIMHGIEDEIKSITQQINQIDLQISSGSYGGGGYSGGSGSGSGNTAVGNSYQTTYKPSDYEMAVAWVDKMKENAAAWKATGNADEQKRLFEENEAIAKKELPKYGVHAVKGTTVGYDTGVWYVDTPGGRRLFDVYHRGGVAGNQPTLKQNEVMAILEKGEPVLDEKRQQGLFRIIDFTTELASRLGTAIKAFNIADLFDPASIRAEQIKSAVPSVTNSNSANIRMGDVYIYGANDDTVKQHQEVSRKMANDLLAQLNIRR